MEALRVEGLSKNFGGVHALSDVSFSVEVGEHLAIIGPNGAGKTTLFNLLNGQLPPTSGRIYFFGQDITTMATHRRTHLGQGRAPTHFAAVSAEVKKFIDESIKHFGKLEGKVGAAFSSSGDLGGGSETAILDILRAFLVHGMIIQGATSGGHYGPVSVGAPNQERKEICEALGTRVAKLVKRLA